MVLTETDGGIVPITARYPMNTVLVPVGRCHPLPLGWGRLRTLA